MTPGKTTSNKNLVAFSVELEAIFLAIFNAVKGVTFVPRLLLQWHLMSHDATANHHHNNPKGYLLPIKKALVPFSNDYRNGYMRPKGASTSLPEGIGSVIGASLSTTLSGTFSYIRTPPGDRQ